MLPVSTRLAAEIYAAGDRLSEAEIAALIDAEVRPVVDALAAYEALDNAHANCPECAVRYYAAHQLRAGAGAHGVQEALRAALAAARGQG